MTVKDLIGDWAYGWECVLENAVNWLKLMRGAICPHCFFDELVWEDEEDEDSYVDGIPTMSSILEILHNNMTQDYLMWEKQHIEEIVAAEVGRRARHETGSHNIHGFSQSQQGLVSHIYNPLSFDDMLKATKVTSRKRQTAIGFR